MIYRWVPEDGLLRVVRSSLLGNTEARDAALGAVGSYLARQPQHPPLVGSTAAARLLGVQPPHLARLKTQGRMPEPIHVEGSVDVYHRGEIETLAKALEAERSVRRQKKEETDATAAG